MKLPSRQHAPRPITGDETQLNAVIEEPGENTGCIKSKGVSHSRTLTKNGQEKYHQGCVITAHGP